MDYVLYFSTVSITYNYIPATGYHIYISAIYTPRILDSGVPMSCLVYISTRLA